MKLILIFAGVFILFVSFQNCSQSVALKTSQASASGDIQVNFCLSESATMLGSFFRGIRSFPYEGAWASDFDGDGLSDDEERGRGFNPSSKDSSGTGHSDLAVARFGASPPTCNLDARQDSDRDGLSDCDESLLMTDPLKPDSDSDGVIDLWEVLYGFNPKNAHDLLMDSDSDELSNLEEIQQGSHPMNPASRTALYSQNLQMDSRGCWNLTVTGYAANVSRQQNEYQFILLEEQNGTTLARSAILKTSSQNTSSSQLILDFDRIAPPFSLNPNGGGSP